MAYGRRRRRFRRKYKRRTGYRPEVNYEEFIPTGDSYDNVTGALVNKFSDVPSLIHMTDQTNNAAQPQLNRIKQNTTVNGRTGRRVYSKNINVELQLHVNGIGTPTAGVGVDLCPFDIFIDVWCFKKQSQQSFPTGNLFDLGTYGTRKMDHTSEIIHLKRKKIHVPLDSIVSSAGYATDACWEKTINFSLKTGKVITYKTGADDPISSDIIENGIYITAMRGTPAINIVTQLRAQGKIRHFFYEF